MSSKLKTYIFIFIFGGLLGAIFDGFHTHSGTTGYENVWIFKMAWWVPFLFGGAAVAVSHFRLFIDKWFLQKGEVSWQQTLAGLILFGIMYFDSGFLPLTSLQKFFVLFLFAIAIWLAFEKTWVGLIAAIPVAIVGTAFESALIHFKCFYYTHPDFAGVPMWLPLLYVAAFITVGNLARFVSTLPQRHD